jgi:hypothetical protein
MIFPEAAVMQVHPLVGPASNSPLPALNSRLLLTNQVAEGEISVNVLTPLELNCPCAQSSKFCPPSGISTGPDGEQGALDGFWPQMRIAIRVIGVAVGTGAAVFELLPQLSSNPVITKASTGAITKHLFVHIEHPAMPWRLRRCQGVRRENTANPPLPGADAVEKTEAPDF